MTTYISENSKSFKWFILGTATFVTMLYAMAVTIAAIALPDMRGTMAATQDQITWAITGNIVATAIFTPLAGWLAARYEIRKILLFSVIGQVWRFGSYLALLYLHPAPQVQSNLKTLRVKPNVLYAILS